MKKDLDFQTYNQIHKLFKVVAMSIKEVMNDPKLQDNKCLVLLDKPIIDTPRGPKPPKSHEPTLRELILDMQKDIKDLKKWKTSVDEMFRQHGWIK